MRESHNLVFFKFNAIVSCRRGSSNLTGKKVFKIWLRSSVEIFRTKRKSTSGTRRLHFQQSLHDVRYVL